MYLLIPIALCLFFGFRIIWGLLDRPWVARSPSKIATVGLILCVFGFVAQDQIHRVEIISAWLLANVPEFAINRSTLSLLNRFVEVVVYAAGAGIVASAMFLRTQLCFERERRGQAERLLRANEAIRGIERDLKFLDVDARIYGGNAEKRRDALLDMLIRHEDLRDEAQSGLRKMGGAC